MASTDRQSEILAELNGEARRAPQRAAVRIADLQGILELKPRLRAMKAAGATPTAAEFNALVRDVEDMHNRLLQVMEALRGRLL